MIVRTFKRSINKDSLKEIAYKSSWDIEKWYNKKLLNTKSTHPYTVAIVQIILTSSIVGYDSLSKMKLRIWIKYKNRIFNNQFLTKIFLNRKVPSTLLKIVTPIFVGLF